MICRTCLRRAAGLTTRSITTQPAARPSPITTTTRTLTTTPRRLNASPSPISSAPATEPTATASTPELTPLTPSTPDSLKTGTLSSCAEGTVLNGLNYFKGKADPVALADAAYPAWLWNCLEVQKKAGAGEGAETGDEFCLLPPPKYPPPHPAANQSVCVPPAKSKKQRRLALKRQRQQEERLLASGDLSALAPKVPLQKQTINLPGAEPGNLAQAVEAADARDELRRAMRKERRAGIRESNYLKSM